MPENIASDSAPIFACKVCGKTFRPKAKNRTTCCGRECGFKWQRIVRADKAALASSAKEAERQARRRKQCAVCEKDFESTGPKRHCSTRCYFREYAKFETKNLACEHCKKPFVRHASVNAKKYKYCSAACGEKAVQKRWKRHAK
jgi:hypothetical protein